MSERAPLDPLAPIGPQSFVVLYRLPRSLRWLLPLGWLVFVPIWIVACVKLKDFSALPFALTLLAALTSVSLFAANRLRVTLTPEVVVARSFCGTSAFAWTEISWVHLVEKNVVITTRSGSFFLPLRAATSSGIVTSATNGLSIERGDPAADLGNAVYNWWIAWRGEQWVSAPLDPWSPDARHIRARRSALLASSSRCVGAAGS